MILRKLASLFRHLPDNKYIKILVIEDNPVDQKVACAAIEKGGYSILQASNGKIGLQMAQESLPDLIILDYNLPDIKGPELCKSLKADTATNRIPILFLTSVSSPGSIIDCYEQGGYNYLAKPIQPKFLLKQIEEALKERKSQE